MHIVKPQKQTSDSPDMAFRRMWGLDACDWQFCIGSLRKGHVYKNIYLKCSTLMIVPLRMSEVCGISSFVWWYLYDLCRDGITKTCCMIDLYSHMLNKHKYVTYWYDSTLSNRLYLYRHLICICNLFYHNVAPELFLSRDLMIPYRVVVDTLVSYIDTLCLIVNCLKTFKLVVGLFHPNELCHWQVINGHLIAFKWFVTLFKFQWLIS